MLSKAFKKFCFSTCALLTTAACLLPANKVEARGEAGVAIAAGVGALLGMAVGSDMAHHKHHHKHAQPSSAQVQQETMRYVLTHYNPTLHEVWVQYVVVDCAGTLTCSQQNQLLEVMNQRRQPVAHISHKTVETRTVCQY